MHGDGQGEIRVSVWCRYRRQIERCDWRRLDYRERWSKITELSGWLISEYGGSTSRVTFYASGSLFCVQEGTDATVSLDVTGKMIMGLCWCSRNRGVVTCWQSKILILVEQSNALRFGVTWPVRVPRFGGDCHGGGSHHISSLLNQSINQITVQCILLKDTPRRRPCDLTLTFHTGVLLTMHACTQKHIPRWCRCTPISPLHRRKSGNKV